MGVESKWQSKSMKILTIFTSQNISTRGTISMKTSWTLAIDSYKIKTVRKIHTESSRKVKESIRSGHIPLGGNKGSEGKRDYVSGEIEENNRMRKTRDLFNKIRDTKGIFHAKMGILKDRNGMDLTEAEDIKKTWQE